MSKTLSRRLWTQSTQISVLESSASRCVRPFSQSSRRKAGQTTTTTQPPSQSQSSQAPAPKIDRFSYGQSSLPSINPRSISASPNAMSNLGNLASILDQNNQDRMAARRNAAYDSLSLFPDPAVEKRPAHQLHVYASRHNCHITLWGPPNSVRMNKKKDKEAFKGGAILSMSAGQLGFRHSGRKHYDSAFQLASYVFARMAEAGVSQDVQDLELYLRGFGAGREAVTKALLGAEGKLLRGKVRKVADTTRLKFGGTRSPKPRRLG